MRLLEGKKSMGYKWVFIIKYNPNWSVESYKAKLVTKRYTQIFEVGYEETSALVAKMNILKILISIVVSKR